MGGVIHPDAGDGVRTDRIVEYRVIVISGEIDYIFFIILNNVVVDVVR
jgi:hypothetical protein